MALAAVAGAHGVRGEVRLKLFAESVESLRRHQVFDAGGRSLSLVSIRAAPAGAIARFAELAGRDAAEALRGIALTVPRSALPPLGPGEYYWHDLLGLAVETPDGTAVGRVIDVVNHGASDIIEVERANGAPSVLVPLIPAAADIQPDRLVVGPEWLE